MTLSVIRAAAASAAVGTSRASRMAIRELCPTATTALGAITASSTLLAQRGADTVVTVSTRTPIAAASTLSSAGRQTALAASSVTRAFLTSVESPKGPSIEDSTSATASITAAESAATVSTASSTREPKKIMIFMGNSGLGTKVIEKALKEGYEIYVTSRKKPSASAAIPGVKYLVTPNTTDPKSWDRVFSTLRKNGEIMDGDHVSLINTIGATIVPEGETIDSVNVLSVTEGLSSFHRSMDGVKFGHLNVITMSSIATYVEGDPYGEAKKKVETVANFLFKNVIHFRIGFAIGSDETEEGHIRITDAHELDPSSLALLPFVVILGKRHKKILFQPVAATDVAEGIVRATDLVGHRIIDAVGSEVWDQAAYTELFRRRAGTPTLFTLYVKPEILKKFSRVFGFGYMNPSNIGACTQGGVTRDPEPFESLIGRSLRTVDDLFPEDKTLELTYPVVMKFFQEICKKCAKQPKRIEVLLSTIRSVLGTPDALEFVPGSDTPSPEPEPVRPVGSVSKEAVA